MTFAVRRFLGFALALSLAVPALADPASDALKALEDGNARFVAGKPAHPNAGMDRVSSTGANGQKPLVTILACSDSRVALERIFDIGIGDAFVVRVAGNVSDTDEIGSAEYGTGHLNTPLMVVLGHTKCGAVTAVATGAALHGSISELVANITPAVERARKKHPGLEGNDLVPFAIEENIFQSVRDILVNSDTIRDLVKDGKLRIVAALYDIDTGKVNWLGAHPEQSALLTAPAAAKTDHAAAPGHGGHAATASKLSSNGVFAPAEMQVVKRGAFGPKAGKAEEAHAVGELPDESSMLFQLFLGAAGVAMVLTAGAAWMLSRTTRADGTPTRTLTVGAKLAAGFGTIVAGTLTLAAVSSGASSTVAHAMAETEHLSDQDLLIASMQSHQLETQIQVKSFLLNASEEELVKYSNSTASLGKTWELARETIKSPERAKLVEDIGDAIESYEETFAEIVKHVDERNAIIDGVMRPAASRATELLSEIATLAWADGQRELGFVASEANERYQEARINFFVFLRTGDPKFAKEAVRLAEVALHDMAGVEQKITNPTHKLLLKEASEAIPFWIAKMEQAEKLQEERNELVATRLDKLGPEIDHLGHELLASLNASKEEVVAKSHAIQNAATMKTTVLAGVTALLGAILAFAIARGVIKGLKTLEVRLIDIAQGEGDLTKRVDIKSCDEVGRIAHWMNAFIGNLHSVISQASGATTQVAAAATEVAASAEEMAAAVSEVARQSTAAATQSESSGKVATQGGNIVRSTVERMNEIETAVNESAASVAALGKRGDEIGQVISVINDIADQTNLLALNAAIEAARAGEHGRGFAVVADEVRKLADRTTKATEEIGESIKAIQNETGLAVGRMDRGREQVKLGVENAVQAGSSLEQIVAGTRDVASMIMAISAASEEAGAGASQSASAATELSSKAELLRTLVERFKV